MRPLRGRPSLCSGRLRACGNAECTHENRRRLAADRLRPRPAEFLFLRLTPKKCPRRRFFLAIIGESVYLMNASMITPGGSHEVRPALYEAWSQPWLDMVLRSQHPARPPWKPPLHDQRGQADDQSHGELGNQGPGQGAGGPRPSPRLLEPAISYAAAWSERRGYPGRGRRNLSGCTP